MVKNLFGDDFHNLQVKYNSIIAEEVVKKAEEEVNDIEKLKDTVLLVTSGRLVSQKGYESLLEACNKLNKDNIKYELWILGEDWARPKLEELINKYRLSNIKLLGFKENPYKYIKQVDLFVCSSKNEGFSLVIAEAMILGLPVISTNCSGPNELLNFGEYGYIVENNEESLYEGLKIIISDDKKLEHYTQKSQERVNFFNYKERINEIIKIFKEKK